MSKLLLWSITVAVAGFLFGFDTAVISGAEQKIQNLWQLSPFEHGTFIVSSALWGTVLGALTGSIPCDRLGRKITLILIGVLYSVSALGSALATDEYTFAILRFIGGIGVGISSIAVPAYISEVAPAQHRGRLVALYQFQIVFGILIAFVSNYFISGFADWDWRLMLGIETLPAVVYLLMVLKVPESPRWLILHKNDVQTSRKILTEIGEQNIDQVISEIKESKTSDTDIKQAKQVLNQVETHNVAHEISDIIEEKKQNAHAGLFSKKYSFPIMLAFLLAFFNQLSGINFILYYAPRVFEMAGLDASASLLSSTGIGLTNLIFTMAGLYLIDMLGRKTLMLIGSVGYILSLGIVAWAFSGGQGGTIVVIAIFGFIAAHAIGQGAVIWVFIAEIFPNSVRAKGQALGSGTHWVFAALISLIMPVALSAFSASHIFIFFMGMMVLQLLYVVFLMPETKGRSLEDIAHSYK
ncbi:sugar porter family MFS transporter [Catenovulum sp. 2E275]|uniref:sugar porter family MFS transporter n=1 Tax=Catenovulum sp. 2E275 TaxID=2980497 RepID=UPI0021D1C5C7|nr:sugar porter family MFS transporter [Catenovulum sp. 2E275]MCU4677013.1 sugar porter family MFS transporter [Catenovulum sp. 2E275]